VLLDVKSIYAVGWVGGNRILPKHIWKPIVTGAIAPKSGLPWDPTTFAPDPNLIGQGPWRLDEYSVTGSYILLVANTPGSVVDTGITTDANANSVPITSTMGFFNYNPVEFEPYTDTMEAKVNPGFPNTSVDVAVTVKDHNRRQQSYAFTSVGPLNPVNPIGGVLTAQPYPFTYTIVGYIDEIGTPVGLSVLDMIQLQMLAPPGATTFWFNVEVLTPLGGGSFGLTLGQVIEVDKTVTLDGNPVVGPVSEMLKPCIPVYETFTFTLDKCKHTISVSKHTATQWIFCPNGHWTLNPEYCHTRTVTWPVWITIPEDITGSYYINTQLLAPDCKVDLKDVFAAGKAFGSVPGDLKWSSVADINHDYKIDLKDYFGIAKKFGKW
jgi:hypothetical protein